MAFETTGDAPKLTKKDFSTDQDVRWCPGCGDYSILAQVQRTMPELGIPREKIAFISGIGCSSRFPYYMKTYGFHTIHGRAPTIATGLRLANPDLTVFVITGDGDALSIGGNHLIHALRRNLDLKIMMFNNRIYGLTKGQYSPTSEVGKLTKSTPVGSLDEPFKPLSIALAAEASFVGRSIDTDAKHLQAMIREMAAHKGSAFLEIYQNCNVFNDGAFEDVVGRKVKDEQGLFLEEGKPMTWAKGTKGLRLAAGSVSPEVFDVTEDNIGEALVHDSSRQDPSTAYMLSRLEYPDFPTPFGVLRKVPRPTYEERLEAQHAGVREARGEGDIDALLNQGYTWTVE